MTDACREVISSRWQNGRLPNCANASLIMDRYLRAPFKDAEYKNARRELHQSMQESLTRSKIPYEGAFNRYKNSIPDSSQRADFKTLRGLRMILGLGNENVLETGLTLHHTYGTPMIPGTALKGLAAHYCDQVWGAKDERFKRDQEYHKALFGTTDDAGHIIFHDAWITPETLEGSLRPDVMTPHHGDYYSEKNEGAAAPTDFDDPNPVTFLSVVGTFHIAVSCDIPEEKDWTSFVFDLLADALHKWGIGGKTSSGYGRLEQIAGRAENEVNETTPPEEQIAPLVFETHRYNSGSPVSARRAEDPRGRGRPYFIADDGIGGFVERGDHTSLPEEIGKPCDLIVINFLKGDNRYSFAIPGAWEQYQPANHGNRR